MKQTGTVKILFLGFLVFVLFCFGCSLPMTETPDGKYQNQPNKQEDLEAGCEEPFCQMLLFLQEGFRQHNIQSTYQVYFTEPEAVSYVRIPVPGTSTDETVFTCSILLEDMDSEGSEPVFWLEELAYTLDEETGWYTFTGQYEPVLTQDTFYTIEDDSRKMELLDTCVYETTLSLDTVLDVPARFHPVSGPETTEYFLHLCDLSQLYTYFDDRLHTDIIILYPFLFTSDDELEALLNEKIHDAFFYGYGYEDDEALHPELEWHPYGVSIQRSYQITRNDKQYFSTRIHEWNASERVNEWETGLTLSLETGNALTLRDIVGEDVTLEQLLNSDAFYPLWTWESDSDQEWMEYIKDYYLEDFDLYHLEDFDDHFYLTEDSLGLCCNPYGCYTLIEAKLADLGLEEWISESKTE